MSPDQPAQRGLIPRGDVAWVDVAKVCAEVAVAAAIANITLPAEMAGGLQEWSVVRKTVAKLISSGTLWAALAVYAGWRYARVLPSLVAGIAALIGSLLVHYVVMMLLGVADSSAFTGNTLWFLAAIALGAPLGACGWVASRRGILGQAGRLVVPGGAVLEPFVTGAFHHPYVEIPWPERYSSTASGVVLIVLGLCAALLVVWRGPYGLTNEPTAPEPAEGLA